MSLEEKIFAFSKNLQDPFFVYDLNLLEQRIKSFENKADFIKLWYAMKANPISSILKKFAKHNWGVDGASSGEIEQALKVGFEAENIITTGPAKSKKYLEFLLQKNIPTIVLESSAQVKILNQLLEGTGKKVSALIRMQKAWSSKEQNVLGGSQVTQFGQTLIDWQELDFSEFQNINFLGFHIFQWGNITSIVRLDQVWREIAKDVKSWSLALGVECKVLDLGGGLGINYNLSNEDSLEVDAICKLLENLKKDFSLNEVWLELGRFMTGPIGYYCTEIAEKKKVNGQEVLVLEGGINHLLRGNLAGEYFPVMDSKARGSQKGFKLYGPLCTSLDYLGEHQLSCDLEAGDKLIFKKVGAYGFTESMPLFLGHNWPSEVIFENNQFEVVRKSLGASSWMV
jgi:diaminopimelate decarboxylase